MRFINTGMGVLRKGSGEMARRWPSKGAVYVGRFLFIVFLIDFWEGFFGWDFNKFLRFFTLAKGKLF